MNRWTPAPLALLVMLAACGEGPTQPDKFGALDEVAATEIAAGVLETTDARLPYLPRLVHEAIRTLREQDGVNEEAVTAFRRARRARRAAAAAHEAGDEEEFRRLRRIEMRWTLTGVIAALGPAVVPEALAGVDAAIARFEERAEGRELPPRFARALARVKDLAERARTAETEVASLYFSVTAADVILSLSPRHRARVAIERATRLFRRARAAVGDAPTEDEVKALRRAHRLLKAAEEAFEAKDWKLAKRAANASADLSQKVIDGRST